VARILVVAHREPVVSLFRTGLAAGGHEVKVLTDGVEAVRRVLTEDFDLVVIDVGLPGDTAQGVLRALRSAMTATPVVVATDPDTVRTALDPRRGCR
jgi:DNA-binding response OmpR family regulator